MKIYIYILINKYKYTYYIQSEGNIVYIFYIY